jgi:hypothetical protein
MTAVEEQAGTNGLEMEVTALRLELEQARKLLELQDAFVIHELAAAEREMTRFREDAERYRGLQERLNRHPFVRRVARGLRLLVR